jgi:hypothetical protein
MSPEHNTLPRVRRAHRPRVARALSAVAALSVLALVSACGGTDEVREAFIAKARASNPSEQNVRVAACVYDEFMAEYDNVALLDRAVGEGWLASPEPPPTISPEEAIQVAAIRTAVLTCMRDSD